MTLTKLSDFHAKHLKQKLKQLYTAMEYTKDIPYLSDPVLLKKIAKIAGLNGRGQISHCRPPNDSICTARYRDGKCPVHEVANSTLCRGFYDCSHCIQCKY